MQKCIKRKDGTWKHYTKRGIYNKAPPFIGWDKILSVIDACNQVDYDTYFREYCIERDKALIATLFETGGRIKEVLSLRTDNFDFSNPQYVVVRDMLLSKRFEKIASYFETVEEMPTGSTAKLFQPKLLDSGKQVWVRKRWKTSIDTPQVKELRIRKAFPILKSEPLFQIMEQWIKRNHGTLLFPSPKTRRNGSRQMTTTNAWLIIHRVEEITKIEMWPHWFREQRASQLAREYGFTWEQLMKWFSWETERQARKYGKTTEEDLAEILIAASQRV